MIDAHTSKIVVLHIHQDYPDSTGFPATEAVRNLVRALELSHPQVQHFVISINRSANPFKVKIEPFEDGLQCVYWGLPLPWVYPWSLKRLSRALGPLLQDQNIDIIHGHKLTTEGSIALWLSQSLQKPFIISIRGGSDKKNIERFPMHRKLFGQVFAKAKHVFWVTPWVKDIVEPILEHPIEQLSLFPNMCDIETLQPRSERSASIRPIEFIVVSSFHQFVRKGVLELCHALKLVRAQGIDARIIIYGGGSDHARQRLVNALSKLDLGPAVTLAGSVSQAEIRHALRASYGLLMPSLNETFGMTYVEALSVHCPIMYMANTGIDGYLTDHAVGVRMTSQSTTELSEGICYMIAHQRQLKENVKKMAQDGTLAQFQAPALVEKYMRVIEPLVAP